MSVTIDRLHQYSSMPLRKAVERAALWTEEDTLANGGDGWHYVPEPVTPGMYSGLYKIRAELPVSAEVLGYV